MYKVIISLVLALILGGIQLFIDKDESDKDIENKNYPIKPLAVFASVFIITYMGQTLIFNGGISMPIGGSNPFIDSTNKLEFEKMIQNIQTGEAPF